MGTRPGDLDPALPGYLTRCEGLSEAQLENLLNRQSGLRGLCGHNDMRNVERLAASGDEPARLALEMFCYRIKKYVGAYHAVLGGMDGLIFTGGIGEHSARVRQAVCEGLEVLGIEMDARKNKERLRDLQIDCRHYAHQHGVDKPEIRDWRWPG